MTILKLTEPVARRDAPLLARRKNGGPYGWLTPHIETMAAANPAIASRVLSLPRDEMHFIALAIALTGEDPAPACLRAFAQQIGCAPREAILRDFAGVDGRMARLCSKLAGRPWRAPTYRRLAALFVEPHARKVLAHLPAITRRSVLTLSRLPAPYRTPGVLRMIGGPKHLSRVLFALEIVRRVRTDLTDRQILASLERARGADIRDWVEAHYERLPFPKAPVATLADGRGAVLRPVATPAELDRLAHEFSNCVDDRRWVALTGGSTLYRFEIDGRAAACVELKPVPGLGWAIEEAEGPGNESLSGEVRERLIALLASAGVAAAPQARSRIRRFYIDW
jgi:hypothetical protein